MLMLQLWPLTVARGVIEGNSTMALSRIMVILLVLVAFVAMVSGTLTPRPREQPHARGLSEAFPPLLQLTKGLTPWSRTWATTTRSEGARGGP